MNISADGENRIHDQSASSDPDVDLSIRPLSLQNHPVFLRNYICPTLQLDDLVASVTQWKNEGTQRAVIVAPPGFGKTFGIRYVSEKLAFQIPGVVCLRIQGASTEISGNGLGQVMRLYDGQRPPAPIILCADLCSPEPLRELASRMGMRTIMLWIDESHLLHTGQDDTLRRLQNELAKAAIRLIILLVGHPAVRGLNEKRVSFADETPRIIPAVRAEEFQLHGLRSPTDIEYCLAAFDNECFPISSDWSYTRFFLPRAYFHGLRLAAHADDLWRIFVEEDPDRKARPATEVPISCLMRTLESALIEGAVWDCSTYTLDEESWRSAVLKSRWVERRELERSMREQYGVNDLY